MGAEKHTDTNKKRNSADLYSGLSSAFYRPCEKIRCESSDDNRYNGYDSERGYHFSTSLSFSEYIEHNCQEQRSHYRGEIISVLRIPFDCHFTLLKRYSDQNSEKQESIIPSARDEIKFASNSGRRKAGETTLTVNHAAAIMLANSDKAFNCASFIVKNSNISMPKKSMLSGLELDDEYVVEYEMSPAFGGMSLN